MNSKAIKTLILVMLIFLVGCSKETEIDKIMKSFVKIDAGEFQMGSETGALINEKPSHAVYLDAYFISRYEVTVAQYVYFLNQTGKDCDSAKDRHIQGEKGNYHFKKGDERFPVSRVSWYDAVEFCQWLSKQTGKNIHLPTEAQWEKACRAGRTDTRYGDLGDIAWYSNNSGKKTNRVGEKQANGFGLYDMLGNLWEWCSDRYDATYYSNSPMRNPSGPTVGTVRVDRGGAWGSGAGMVSASYRDGCPPAHRGRLLGFRLAMTNPD